MQKTGLFLLILLALPLSAAAQQNPREEMRREMERMQEEMSRFFEYFEMPQMPEDGYLKIDTFFFHRLDPSGQEGDWPFSEEALPGDLDQMLQELLQNLPGWELGEGDAQWEELFKGFGTPWGLPEDALPEGGERKPAVKKRRTYTL